MTCIKFMVAATLGKNLQAPVMFWGWHFKSSVCICWAVIRNDGTKIYTNVTIYKTLKIDLTYNAKIAAVKLEHLSGLIL